jgi:hypothetical protein
MPQASSRLPRLITLVWGSDRLQVDDPIWIAKIMQEMANASLPRDDYSKRLSEPRSRMHERIETAMGFRSNHNRKEGSETQMGYQAPEQQGPVAAEALKVFLGLELPVALNFTSTWGNSKHRMSAVDTYFSPCWRNSMPDELDVHWMLKGYQLYASHQIGSVHRRPHGTESMGYIERRLLSGQWVRWGFDGALSLPSGRRWSTKWREFILEASVIKRIGLIDSDLMPEYDESEFEEDREDGISPQQEAT